MGIITHGSAVTLAYNSIPSVPYAGVVIHQMIRPILKVFVVEWILIGRKVVKVHKVVPCSFFCCEVNVQMMLKHLFSAQYSASITYS